MTKPRHAIALLALLLAAALAAPLLGGCSSAPPKPSKEQVEAQQRAAEAKRREEAERARKQAEAQRKAQAEQERKEVQAAFGPIGHAPGAAAQAAPGGTAAAGAAATAGQTGPAAAAAAPAVGSAPSQPAQIPFDQAVPPLPPEPTVRIAVLSHDAPLARGRQVALQLVTYDRDRIEARLGKALKIAYVAESRQPLPLPSEIHYRKDFLVAAQEVALALADQQAIGPMTASELRQKDVDLVVHIGKGYR